MKLLQINKTIINNFALTQERERERERERMADKLSFFNMRTKHMFL